MSHYFFSLTTLPAWFLSILSTDVGHMLEINVKETKASPLDSGVITFAL